MCVLRGVFVLSQACSSRKLRYPSHMHTTPETAKDCARQWLLALYLVSCSVRLLFASFGYFLIWPSCWIMTHIGVISQYIEQPRATLPTLTVRQTVVARPSRLPSCIHNHSTFIMDRHLLCAHACWLSVDPSMVKRYYSRHTSIRSAIGRKPTTLPNRSIPQRSVTGQLACLHSSCLRANELLSYSGWFLESFANGLPV